MFGLDKKTILKKNIIDILDAQVEPLVSKELCWKLGMGSSALVLENCKEIQTTLSKVYSDGRVKILIEKNGISLIRHNSSLQFFFEQLYSQDLSYQIIKTLIVNREFNTNEFCIKSGVSLSTLRRKIRAINQSFLAYDVRITVSNRVNIVGTEIDIRNVTMLFLSGIHRQFSRIPWVNNKSIIKELAKDIFEYLGMHPSDIQMEQLSIIILSMNLSRSLNREISLNEDQKKIISTLNIKRKPEFLLRVSQIDWEFLYLNIYISDYFDAFMELESFGDKTLDGLCQVLTDQWIETFEEYFKVLDVEMRIMTAQVIRQQFVKNYFVPQMGDFFTLTNSFDIKIFRKTFPEYSLIFEKFWSTYLKKIKIRDIEKNLFCYKSLLLCLYFCGTEEVLLEKKIFLYSDQGKLYNHYLEQRVKSSLKSKFRVVFVNEPTDASLILSTVPISQEKFETKRLVLIKSPIRNADILEILNAIDSD